MAKALFGHVVTEPHALTLTAEVRRLRARVAELETRLEQASRANEELHRLVPLAEELHLDDALPRSADMHSELLALDEPVHA